MYTHKSDFEGGKKVFLQTQIFFPSWRPRKERWVYPIKPPFFRFDKSGSSNSDLFLVGVPEKNPSLQNHFSATLKTISKGAD